MSNFKERLSQKKDQQKSQDQQRQLEAYRFLHPGSGRSNYELAALNVKDLEAVVKLLKLKDMAGQVSSSGLGYRRGLFAWKGESSHFVPGGENGPPPDSRYHFKQCGYLLTKQTYLGPRKVFVGGVIERDDRNDRIRVGAGASFGDIGELAYEIYQNGVDVNHDEINWMQNDPSRLQQMRSRIEDLILAVV